MINTAFSEVKGKEVNARLIGYAATIIVQILTQVS